MRDHVELGYATTAYRAQGRTVDTAHAFVSATTQREPLYVMSARGRGSNRLYVDTTYDPDVQTAHIDPDELDAVEVLRHVTANTGAEKSAAQTIADQWADAHSVRQLWAEYTTIAQAANHDRYGPLIQSCLTGVVGLARDEAEAIEASSAYGPLLAAMQQAESHGLDVDQALPRLIHSRSLAGVDDVAAVLHARVTKWTRVGGSTASAGRSAIVGGPLPTVATDDPDVRRALGDRRALIERAARAITVPGVEQHQAWTASPVTEVDPVSASPG